jgi:hypothetical protein
LIRVPESFGQKERGEESKKKILETPPKKISAYTVFRLQDRFELYTIILNFFLHLHAFQSSFEQFSEISKKNLDPIPIFHLADRFEALSIIVIFASFARCSEHCCLLLFGVAA